MRTLALLLFAAGFASALDGNHIPYKPKTPVYPKSESWYLKRFTTPQVNCGACFGYYRPQWKSWAEACNEPEMHYAADTSKPTEAVKPVAPPPVKVEDTKPAPVPTPVPMPKIPDVSPMPVPNPIPNPVPTPIPNPVPTPIPTPIPEPKKGEPGKSAQLPALQAVPVSRSTDGIPLVPTIPVVNVK